MKVHERLIVNTDHITDVAIRPRMETLPLRVDIHLAVPGASWDDATGYQYACALHLYDADAQRFWDWLGRGIVDLTRREEEE